MSELALDQKIQALRRFSRFFSQRLGALEAGPAGSSYSATEVRVLVELAQFEQRTVTALSRALGLDAGYLSRVIRRLETTGIVSKSADSSDSRQQPLALTPAGRAEVATLEAISTTRYASLVRMLPSHIHAPVLDAMERIESAFGMDVPARDASPWLLRPHRVGDISLAVQSAITSALEEFELNGVYESQLLRTASEFLDRYDSARDCSWMAEREGSVVGSVLVQGTGALTAHLSMLNVESRARGVGIGRRLITEAVEFAARAGYATLELELLDVMKTARFLVHTAGFRLATATTEDLFGRTLARQLWRLDLQSRAGKR